MTLLITDHVASIIGILSDYINVDSENDAKRKHDERTLDQEIKWCIYLAIQSVMVSLPMDGSFTNLARLIYARLKVHHSSPMVLIIFLNMPPSADNSRASNFINFSFSCEFQWYHRIAFLLPIEEMKYGNVIRGNGNAFPHYQKYDA